jgi:hypothetical protein
MTSKCQVKNANVKSKKSHSTTNYVDQILPDFDPFPPWMDNCGHFTWYIVATSPLSRDQTKMYHFIPMIGFSCMARLKRPTAITRYIEDNRRGSAAWWIQNLCKKFESGVVNRANPKVGSGVLCKDHCTLLF